MASTGNVDDVTRTLREGGVSVDERVKEFAAELVRRACNKSSAGGRKSGERVMESEMRKKAAGYSLLDMQESPVGELV